MTTTNKQNSICEDLHRRKLVELNGYNEKNVRLKPMRETFQLIHTIIQDKDWYDFGCGFGASGMVLKEFGAREVLGFEPDISRVEDCPVELNVVSTDTIERFDNVLAYGVFEHIYPELRQDVLLSLWSRLKVGGHMVIADTPNSLLPVDIHTTHLPLIPWLPENIAKWIAEHSHKKWDWGDWRSCGWKGLWFGDFRMENKINRSPIHRPKHEKLLSIGLHPHLFDPWPVWVWEKT